METYDIRHLDADKNYTASATRLFEFYANDNNFNIVQGGCIVGNTFRVAMVHRDENKYETARIITLDMSGKLISESDIMHIDHANNLTYNEKNNTILATHCQAPSGNYDKYTVLDADNYTVLASENTGTPFFSMAYSPEKDKYASGQWAGQTLNVWSGELQVEKTASVEQPKSLSQGVFCDGDHIYFVRSSQNGAHAEIRVYDWELRLVRIIPLTLEDSIEPESINIKDGISYVIANDSVRGRGVCFRLIYNAVD